MYVYIYIYNIKAGVECCEKKKQEKKNRRYVYNVYKMINDHNLFFPHAKKDPGYENK